MERGQSMVETAFVLLPFLLLAMGIFDFGRVAFYNHQLASAARDGARAAIAPGRTADQACAAAARSTLLPNTSGARSASTCGNFGDLSVQAVAGTPGDAQAPVQVTLRYVFRPITPIISRLIGSAITLGASSSMYVES
jgi:Flp pilus assembly protein TadG